MADKTGIEWTDATWNPIRGCTKVSPGCDNCYAERDDNRWNGPGSFDTVRLFPERLDQPLKWRKPRRIFVNSMSDLFHDKIEVGYIARVFAVMATASRHTFQVLTKRHARMRSLLNSPDFQAEVYREALAYGYLKYGQPDPDRLPVGWWPLSNVWLGVSVENQQWADIRIPALLETPAAVRWISAEPLLGPVVLHDHWIGADPYRRDEPRLDWVVVGGESGPGARPMHPDWARSLRDQCQQAGVPYLFKQHGEWVSLADSSHWVSGWDTNKVRWVAPDGSVHAFGDFNGSAEHQTWHRVQRVGKKRAGRELDGREWSEYPR